MLNKRKLHALEGCFIQVDGQLVQNFVNSELNFTDIRLFGDLQQLHGPLGIAKELNFFFLEL